MGTFSGYTDLSVILVNHFVSQFDNYAIKFFNPCFNNNIIIKFGRRFVFA